MYFISIGRHDQLTCEEKFTDDCFLFVPLLGHSETKYLQKELVDFVGVVACVGVTMVQMMKELQNTFPMKIKHVWLV